MVCGAPGERGRKRLYGRPEPYPQADPPWKLLLYTDTSGRGVGERGQALTTESSKTIQASAKAGAFLMGVNDMPEIQIPQGTYRYGCKGDNVKEIQRRLKALGYFSGTIGGNYLAFR